MEKVGNEIILKSFSEFVIGTKLLDTESLNDIMSDEIIAIYIINTINQFFEQYDNEQKWLDSNSIEEAFEIENFIEIIDAYLSGFSQLNQSDIIKWLTQLKQLLNNTLEASTKTEIIETKNEIVEKELTTKNEPVTVINYNENVISLNEIFPTLSLKEINTIYKKTNQNYDKTIDELLIIQNASVVDSSDDDETTNEKTEEDRRLLKEKTVKQFGFIAVKETDNEHTKINVPKWDSNKKLVRYFESKVVTTKGDKYFEPRTEEDEELAKQMKKTYVNLKPARKYRFH